MSALRLLVLITSSVTLTSCSDAYREKLIEALGEEDAGFDPSEIHRPGQPCVLCHSEYGGAEPLMSVGGTLFSQPAPDQPPFLVGGFNVYLIDSEGNRVFVPVNRCGNFYVVKDEFDPAFPILAEVWDKGPDRPLAQMASRIGRDGSCGTCHKYPASWDSPGVVFVPQSELVGVGPPPPGACPPPRFAEPQIPPP